jgi:hypothetical protein
MPALVVTYRHIPCELCGGGSFFAAKECGGPNHSRQGLSRHKEPGTHRKLKENTITTTSLSRWMQPHLSLLGGVAEGGRRQNEESFSREEGQPPRKLCRVVGDVQGVEGGFVDTAVILAVCE